MNLCQLKTLSLAPLIVVSMQSASMPDSLLIEERTTIPIGYSDTIESGEQKAARDIAKGQPAYALIGLPSGAFVEKLVGFGIEPIFFGCLVQVEGQLFWQGYNRYILRSFQLD
jgi:hypothetical protein